MKKILVFFLPLFMLMMFTASTAQTNSLTKEQKEFVEILKAILMDKEINKYLEANNFFWKAEGKTVYILNKNTPFFEEFESGTPSQDYRETYKKKTQLSICADGVIFFVMPEKYLSIMAYHTENNLSNIVLNFSTNKNKILLTKEFKLKKEKTWKLIN